MENSPNFFYFATSELSQDAFFAWLLSWGNTNEDPALHHCALELLRVWTEHKIKLEGDTPIKVMLQYQKIDLLVLVNQKYAIVVEDKTDTSQHGNQLERYENIIKETFKDYIVKLIYLKTGNDCAFAISQIKKSGYRYFSRFDVLEVLKQESPSNQIFRDYVSYLTQLHNETNQVIIEGIPYSIRQLQGFFMRLEDAISLKTDRIRTSWHSVPNRATPFWAFTFGWRDFDGFQLYWQFEFHPSNNNLNRLVCKMHLQDEAKVANKDVKRAVLETFKDNVQNAITESQKSSRIGKSMTLFEWQMPNLYPEIGLTIQRAIDIINTGTHIIDKVSM